MDTKNRILNRGGFMAALICLFVAACGPNGGTDSGMTPDNDGGMPLDDADVPPPDSGMPPDDGGIACDSHSDCADFDVGYGASCVMQGGTTVCASRCPTDANRCGDIFPGTWCADASTYNGSMERACLPTGGDCTDELMRDRVTPPCDPDTRTGAGTGPTGLEGFVGSGTGWTTFGGGCSTGLGESPDSMGRIGLIMACSENGGIEPYLGLYYYDLDGLWYANYQNRATQEWSRMSFDPETGHDIATIELFHANEDTPYQTVMAYR